MRSTLEEKNLLLGSKLFPLRIDSLKRETKVKIGRVAFPESVLIYFKIAIFGEGIL